MPRALLIPLILATFTCNSATRAGGLSGEQQAAARAWLDAPIAERGDIEQPVDLSRDDAVKVKDELWKIYGESESGKASLQVFGPLPPTMQEAMANAKDGRIALQGGAVKIGEHVMPFFVIRRESNQVPEGGRNFFICTHGGGANGQVEGPHAWPINTREWQVQAQLAAGVYPSDGIYFVPRMADDRLGRWWHKHNQQAFDQVIRHAIMHWDVNPNRVYKIGISEGGYGTAILAPFMADRWAGVDAMAAGVGLGNPPENLRNVAFRTDVGENDNMFDRVTLAKKFHDRLDELHKEDPDGYIHSIGVQAGKGHGIDYRAGIPWMTGHARNATPDKVVWINKPLHGERRGQFYWLGLKGETLEGVIRIIGEVDKAANTVNITAEQLAIEGGGSGTHGGEGAVKNAEPLKHATLSVMLSDNMLNLDKPVKIIINGQTVHEGKVSRHAAAMLTTLAQRGDPSYCFAAQVLYELE